MAASTTAGARAANSRAVLSQHGGRRYIVVDRPVSETNSFPFFPDPSGAPYDLEQTQGYLPRGRIDTMGESTSCTEERLIDHAGEFAGMDDRFESLSSSWGVLGRYQVPGQRKPDRGFGWIGAPPVATVKLPIRIPHGLRGNSGHDG